MSWGMEELEEKASSSGQRRPSAVANASRHIQYPFIVTSSVRVPRTSATTQPSERSQPTATPVPMTPRLETRSLAAGSRTVRPGEHSEPAEVPGLATPRPAARSTIIRNLQTNEPVTAEQASSSSVGTSATVRSSEFEDEEQDSVTPRPAPRRSGTSNSSVQDSGQTQPDERQASIAPESTSASSATRDTVTHASEGRSADNNPALVAAERVYYSDNRQYSSESGPGNHGNPGIHSSSEAQGAQGTQGTRTHGTQGGPDGNDGSQWGSGNQGVNLGSGENSLHWQNEFGLGGATSNHSRLSTEAQQFLGQNHHNLPPQNQFHHPFYPQHPYFLVPGLEFDYMPPPNQQPGFGNPGFPPFNMNDEAAMRNTYGFPLPMVNPGSMHTQMQMPPPVGGNAYYDPIPRPPTQVHNPFPPQPPISSGASYGPPPPPVSQPGYHSLPNASTTTMPPPINAPSAPLESMTVDMVTHENIMPFENGAINSYPAQWGVAKIMNIPYAVTKQEIVHFIGRNSNMITPAQGCAIHIIMERSTSKTMDCYVEFQTKADAEAAVAKVNRIYETGRIPRLGSRHVDVEVSSQDALLKDLFPRAKQIIWRNGTPVLGPNDDPYSTGFQGFFTHEEIFLLIRHAENPQRSPFSMKCLWRAYECTISTLKKFPWFATGMYTVEDRNQLFTVTLRHITALLPKIEKSKVVGLDHKLLVDLLEAGLSCPGFNERQKFALVMASKVSTEYHRLSVTARYWPFDTLSMKANTSDGTMMHYADLIQKGLAVKDPSTQTLPNSYRTQYQGESPFGKIWLEWGFNNTANKFQTAAEYELQLVRSLILEGYTANAMTGGTFVSTSSSQQAQIQQQAQQPQGQVQGHGGHGHAQMQQGGGNGGSGSGHQGPLPPNHHPQPPYRQQQNFGGHFTVPNPSSFFPASGPGPSSAAPGGGPLPTQMSTIPPGSMPLWSHGPAGNHPANFNMPLPQLHHQLQQQQTPFPAQTAGPNVGGGRGGDGSGSGFNQQQQSQGIQGQQRQGQNSNQQTNQQHAQARYNRNSNNSSSSQKKRN